MNDHKRVEIEKRIAGRLISDALAAGYTIDVNDGEETVLKRAVSKRAILAAMFSTDSDGLTLRTGPGGRVGSILFVWGNGCDVLSDWTDNDKTNDILKGALAVSEKADA